MNAPSPFNADRIDALSVADLRAAGGLKWTRFPDDLGAFVAETDYGTVPEVTEALLDAVERGRLGYLPDQLGEQLSEVTAEYLTRTQGLAVDAGRVRPLADIVQGFMLFMQWHVAPGKAIVVPTPAYMPFLSVPCMLGVPVVELPMVPDGDGWAFDFEGLERAFVDGAAALILCNPHNPIGKAYSRDELARIADIVERAGAIVFSDEIHAPILIDERVRHVPYATVSETAAQHSVTATSASKAYNIPGTKCCQVLYTSDRLWERWSKVGPWYEHQASTLGVIATMAAYQHGAAWLDGQLAYLRENVRLALDLLRELAPSARVVAPQATYLLWIDIRDTPLWAARQDGASAGALVREASGVAVTDGAECGEVGAGHVRFNVALPRPVLREAIERLSAALG